ncbi:MAG: MFS transporter [Candidatus Brocadiaceae bacterium]|nr:MFS transporter [Candidatus Brocadiaceae bacterium]
MAEQTPAGLGFRSVPAEYRKRGYRHTASAVFCGTFTAVVAGQGPFVIRKLNGSAFQSLIIDLGLAVPLIFAFLWGPFLRRRNPVRFTGLSFMAGGLLVLLSGLAQSLWALALVLAGGMLMTALSRPSMGVAFRQVYPDRWRGKLLSLPNAVDVLAQVVALAVVGLMLERDLALHRCVFPAAGVALLVGGLLFRGIRGSRGDRTEDAAVGGRGVLAQAARSARVALGNHGLLLFLLGYSVTTLGSVSAIKILPLFASDCLDLTTRQYGYALAAYQVAIVLSLYPWGVVMDRFGAPVTAVMSWLLQLGLFVALFFVSTWPAFFVLVAARGLFQSGNNLAFYPIVMHFTRASETQHGMALHFTIWGLRWTAITFGLAWIVDAQLFPMRWVFLGGAVMVLAGVAVMVAAWRRYGKAPVAEDA